MKRRVVVTGMGAITPIGNDAHSFWENAKSGTNGIGHITRFDTEGFKAKLAAEVKNFVPEDYMPAKEVKRADVFTQYALAAAELAIIDSALDTQSINPEQIGVFVGSGIGGLGMIEEQVLRMEQKGPGRVSPMFIPMVIANMASGSIAMRYGAKGIASAVVTACAAGNNSIGEAFRYIKHGYAQAVLAGGSESTITKIGVAGFSNLTALSFSQEPERASIPFDKERNGFVMGEGAGILVMEEAGAAKARGARIYAEVAGYGANCDSYHMTAPDPEGAGAARAMQLAMEEAGIEPADIGYINAHGTSTPANDIAETLAIRSVFGKSAEDVLISSTKSMTGHLLGATGAVESIAAIMAIVEGIAPPTIGYRVPDPACDLNYTPNKSIKRYINASLNNSFGFGGHNAVLCFKRWEE